MILFEKLEGGTLRCLSDHSVQGNEEDTKDGVFLYVVIWLITKDCSEGNSRFSHSHEKTTTAAFWSLAGSPLSTVTLILSRRGTKKPEKGK